LLDIGSDQIELKVHGLSNEDHGRVPARVFANKLKQLVSALEAADKIANGEHLHTYVLSSMHMSEPTAVLREILIDDMPTVSESAIPTFNDAIEGIKIHDARIERLAPVVRHIGLLTSGVESKFGFAEIRTTNNNVVRVDDFLRRRAVIAKKSVAEPWFSGAVMASFDGVLDYVDARGALPQIKLTLTAGGKEIDCICRQEDIEAIGDALKKRVRVFGRAIYASSSPLPMRVEVTAVETVKQSADFTRWRGAFRPFEIASWDADA
jgi:hypothetical protein